MLIMRKPFALRQIRWSPTIVIAMINMALPWTLIGFSETRLASDGFGIECNDADLDHDRRVAVLRLRV